MDGYHYEAMQDLSTFLCLLVPLQLVLIDGVCGTCQGANYPIYVQYSNRTMFVSGIQEFPSLICNEWSISSGNGSFITDADNDTSASCCFCANEVSLCVNLDHAFSYLNKTIASRGGLYAYVAMHETEDSSNYSLLYPHTLSGNWCDIAILGFGDVSIECVSGAGLVIDMFSTVNIEGTSWKGCGLAMAIGSHDHIFYGALFVTNSYMVALCDVAFVGSNGSSMVIHNVLHDPSIPCSCMFQNCSFRANKNPPALGGGGVHYYSSGVAACTLTFINNSFESNAARDGGAVYILSNMSTKVEILGCNFTDNMAICGNGGAVFINSINSLITLNCSNSNLSRNQATDNGGAIYITQEGEYIWKEILFSDNFAGKGGAVYLAPMQIQNTKHIFLFVSGMTTLLTFQVVQFI